MNRYFTLVMALVFPLCANAEEPLTQEQIDAMSERLRADPCAYAEGELRRSPPPIPPAQVPPLPALPRLQQGPPSQLQRPVDERGRLAQHIAQHIQRRHRAEQEYNGRVIMLTGYIQMCTDRDPCAGADLFARRGPAQMRTSVLTDKTIFPAETDPQVQARFDQSTAERDMYLAKFIRDNERARADFQPTLTRLRSACTASRNPTPTDPSPIPSAMSQPQVQPQTIPPPKVETAEERRVRRFIEKAKKYGLMK